MTQPLAELYGGCMAALKVPRCGIVLTDLRAGRPEPAADARLGLGRVVALCCRPSALYLEYIILSILADLLQVC